MSRDTKRIWNEEVEEAENNVNQETKSNSRENSNSRERKKTKPNSENKQSKPKKPVVLETDPGVLQRRQKQIDYGKNTVGYANYTQQIPTDQRTKEHPMTPDKYTKYSRRGWDMLIKIWRKKLHEFDIEGNHDNDCGNDEENENNDDDGNDEENENNDDDGTDVLQNEPSSSDQLYSLF